MFAASKSGKAAAAAAATDPYFPYVPLLLNTTSTNGQQNNTFLDSSTNNFTITRNGTPTQGAFTPYQPSGYWSGYFSSSYLSVADSASLRFGSGNFTIEAWVFRTASGATHTIACKGASTPTGWVFQISSADKLVFIDTSTSITGSTSIPANTWTYVAVVRAGTGASQTTLYVNGASDGTGTSGTTFSQTDAMRIATDRSAANSFAGYISNLRLSNTNLSISNQTAPLSVIGSTIFYSLGYNRFLDGSTLASTITVGSGTPSIQAFQPFSPAASYSAATYGGSGYFNGSTDYVTTADNAALELLASDFTIECWVYPTGGSGTSRDVISKRSAGANYGGYSLYLDTSNNCGFVADSDTSAPWAVAITGTTVLLSEWTHLAVTRNGSTWTLWRNGVSVGTATSSITINDASTSVGVGAIANGNQPFTGYITDARIVKGTPVYTGAFTPPTLAPLKTAGSTSAASYSSTTNVNTSFAAANTSLLTNFTNAGIYDAAWQNNALTVGDAQVSTTQKQWGTTSMKFDGTGDYLDILGPNPAFNLSSGDWTIEAWIYRSVANANHCILNLINAFGSNSGLSFYVNSSNQLATDNGAAGALSGGTVPANQWVYLAIVRSSGTTTGYVNGTSIGTTTQAPTTAQYARIGGLGGGGSPFNGYIQDLRITKGVARTITTPTAAFPTR